MVFIIHINVIYSQVKNELEAQVTLKEFPSTAQKVIAQLPDRCKRLKFFKETDGNKLSYEAKFKFKKKFYSLEFSKEGQIEDVEITMKPKLMTPEIKNNIKKYFDQTYIKVNWVKLQKQFVYESSIGIKGFLNSVFNTPPVLKPNFELVAEVKNKKTKILVEFLFGPSGRLIKQSIISPSSYDYVLY